MRIGPLTIRRIKDVEREQSEQLEMAATIHRAEVIENKKAKVIPDALIHKQAAELVKLKAKLHRWGKDVIFHKCTHEKTRPYSVAVCSICMGKGEDFNAYKRFIEYENVLKRILCRSCCEDKTVYCEGGDCDCVWCAVCQIIDSKRWDILAESYKKLEQVKEVSPCN